MRIGLPFLACIAVLQLGDQHADEPAEGHDGADSFIGDLLDVFHVDVEVGGFRLNGSRFLFGAFGGFHKVIGQMYS